MENLFGIFQVAASALKVQRLRLGVISNNIANVNTTHTEEGGAYHRRQIIVEAKEKAFQPPLPDFILRRREEGIPELALQGVQAERIRTDDLPGPRVYEPDHPDAGPDGYVEYPNVDVVTEMTDMLSATRSYRASVTVLNTIKQTVLKTLEIGRG
jgi:flagellar basal-body rod protein FlgC